MSKFTVIHMKAPNDIDGNPRRCFVVYDMAQRGKIVAVYDEEYSGRGAIKNRYHSQAFFDSGITQRVSPSEYRTMIQRGGIK